MITDKGFSHALATAVTINTKLKENSTDETRNKDQ